MGRTEGRECSSNGRLAAVDVRVPTVDYQTNVALQSRGGAAEHSPKDFLFVQSTTELGGAERVLLNLFAASEELRRRGLIVTLGFSGGNLPERLRAVGAEVVELKMPRLRYLWRLWPIFRELAALVRARGVRTVIGNGGHPQVIASLVSRLTGVRSAFIVHSIYRKPRLKNEALDVVALTEPCDLMLAVSRSAQAAVAELRPNVPNRLVYNGTPIPEVSPAEARAARSELGAGDDDVLIGVFGRLQRWKGQDVFLKAGAEIARARSQSRFAVVGGSVFGLEPEYFEELRRLAAAPELSGRVVFTGFQTEVARLMAACDVVCHTSRVPEPFGLVLIEAMALRRPVIATMGGGPSEIIASESQGILVPPDDPAALAQAALALIDDPERRIAVGAGAYDRVRSQFSIDVMAATLVRCLDEMP
jgi:glycosyltransferase involved in cell wall biosynthesis